MIRAIIAAAALAIANPVYAETNQEEATRVITLCQNLGELASAASVARIDGVSFEDTLALAMIGIDPDNIAVSLVEAAIASAFAIQDDGTFRAAYLALANKHQVISNCLVSLSKPGEGT